jgi:hypothetical protein
MERSEVSNAQAAISAELEAIGKRLGLSITLDPRGTFDHEAAYFKLTVTRPGANGESVPRHALDFKVNARRYGLTADDLNATFRYAGEELTLVGAAPKSHRFPLIARKPNGKLIKVPIEAVASLKAGRA